MFGLTIVPQLESERVRLPAGYFQGEEFAIRQDLVKLMLNKLSGQMERFQ